MRELDRARGMADRHDQLRAVNIQGQATQADLEYPCEFSSSMQQQQAVVGL